ncbi:MAG: CBS domain-containing protein [Pirellulales bacterium]
MSRVDQIMNRTVITVTPETKLAEAVRLFTQHHIGGAPVVDGEGRVVGMVSELQLLDLVFDPTACSAPVSAYMTENVKSVAPADSLAHAGQLFALFAFRRLPVIDDGKLVGIITRRDLMNHTLTTGEQLAEPLWDFVPDLVEVA